LSDSSEIQKRIVLCGTNGEVKKINAEIIERVHGEKPVLVSHDRIAVDTVGKSNMDSIIKT
jgi:hypothetical protein